MKNFIKYQHVERFGTSEVESIELGEVYVFPKIDGTNGSVWLKSDGVIGCGSRTRELSLDRDNQGFMDYIINGEKKENIKKYFQEHPNHRLFGEWLVPHTLKTYKTDAWKHFYIFDVTMDKEDDSFEYLPYSVYSEFLNKFELDYIAPMARIKNGSYDQFVNQLEKNVFLIEDGKGSGEGIVIKNYGFVNRYGRTTWAKIVKNEFKEQHAHTMGAPKINGQTMIEEKIVENYITESLVEKEYSKIVNDCDGWTSKYIPRLLETVYHCLIEEEMWNILKKFKPRTINFQTLKTFVIQKTKEIKPDIF